MALAPQVVAGFVRISTSRRVYPVPTPVDQAMVQIDQLLGSPLVSWAMPGPRHWKIFAELCRAGDARGNLISDAAIAAIAVEHGATVVALDRIFARFPGLRWETQPR